MELSLIGYGRVVFFAPPAAAERLREISELEPNVSIVEFRHDPWQPAASVLPPLRELLPDLPEPDPDPWDELGNAPTPDPRGALPSQTSVELPETDLSPMEVPRIRLRLHDDYAPTSARRRRGRRGWRL